MKKIFKVNIGFVYLVGMSDMCVIIEKNEINGNIIISKF